MKFMEYTGIKNLVAAELIETVNPVTGAVTESYGEVFALSGIQTLAGEVSESSETHFYDNMAAIVVDSEGADTYTLTVSVPDKKTRAVIEGLTYDAETGALVGSKKVKKYFALGFIAGTTSGIDEYNWIYKGKFAGGSRTVNTQTDGVDTTNMEYTYTSINAGTEYTTGGHAKYLSVDDDGQSDLSTFFNQVTTPDMLEAAKYDLTVTAASGTTVTVTKGGTTVTPGTDVLTGGDIITIAVTGGTIKVNGVSFTSGGSMKVLSDITVVATATPTSDED